MEHFLISCFQQLDDCERRLSAAFDLPLDPDRLQDLLAAFAEQAAEISDCRGDLDNLQRARLSYIQMVANETRQRLRRSPRRTVAVRIRIQGQHAGLAWEEDTLTNTISREGASIGCKHQLQNEDRLLVIRVDTEKEARARVAWSRKTSEGGYEAGIEFLDRVNFWEENAQLERPKEGVKHGTNPNNAPEPYPQESLRKN